MRALVLITLGILALVGVAIGLTSTGLIAPADYFSPRVTVNTTSWFPLINLRHNAFLHWRLDSVFFHVFALLPVHDLKSGMPLSALLVFFSGLSLLFLRVSKHRGPAATVFACFATCLTLLCLFGWDSVLFQSFAWAPFLTICLIACLYGREAFGLFFVLSLFFALRTAKSANELAPLVVIVCLCVAAFLYCALLQSNADTPRSDRAEPASTPRFLKILALLAVASLTIAAMPVFDAPALNGQDYPWQSHVVSEDWISGNVHPLLGPGPAVPFIDRQILKSFYGPLSLGLLLLSLLLRFKVLRGAPTLPRYGMNAAVAGFFVAALDSNLPETIAYISPLAVFARIIPGSFLFPLVEISTLLALLGLTLAFCSARKVRFHLCVCLAILIADKGFLQEKLTRVNHQFDPTLSAEWQKYLISPSFPVIDSLGMWVLPERERVQLTQFVPASTVPMKVIASHNNPANDVSKMFDQDRGTRWSAGRAFQQGDEWLYLRFEQIQNLSAIELAPAFFKSDYPAALRISSVENCPENFTSPQSLSSGTGKAATERRPPGDLLIEYKPWHGSLDYTSRNFPFYTAQKRVRAFFPKVTAVQCLLIEQIGADSRVDWSVAEIRLGFEGSPDNQGPVESLDVLN